MTTKSRISPSGPVDQIRGIIALAATAVATTGAATQTGTFADVFANDIVTLSPQANLEGSLAIAWARVVTDNVVCVGFTNVGASTNTGAVTFDCDVARQHRANS